MMMMDLHILMSMVEKIQDEIILSWNGVEEADGYKIYRKTGEEAFQCIAIVTDQSYIEQEAKKGETYFYRVYPYSKSGGKEVQGKSVEYVYIIPQDVRKNADNALKGKIIRNKLT